MMDSCDKLLFRMQHLIPRGLTSAAPKKTNNTVITEPGIPSFKNHSDILTKTYEEVTFPMTYGNVAGNILQVL